MDSTEDLNHPSLLASVPPESSNRRRALRKRLWWDLSHIESGLDRKIFKKEIRKIREQLSGYVPYLDSLEERALVLEACTILGSLSRGLFLFFERRGRRLAGPDC